MMLYQNSEEPLNKGLKNCVLLDSKRLTSASWKTVNLCVFAEGKNFVRGETRRKICPKNIKGLLVMLLFLLTDTIIKLALKIKLKFRISFPKFHQRDKE